MRGLLNIFSLGMDQLAAQIQSHGIDASVYNHTFADVIVNRIVQMYRAGDHGPYMLVGHSLGADAVMGMAQELNAQAVPVALVVPVDGTGSSVAPRNVACVINLTQRRYAYMRPGAGFHGILDRYRFLRRSRHRSFDDRQNAPGTGRCAALCAGNRACANLPARRRRPDHRAAARSAQIADDRRAKDHRAGPIRLAGAAAGPRRLNVTPTTQSGAPPDGNGKAVSACRKVPV